MEAANFTRETFVAHYMVLHGICRLRKWFFTEHTSNLEIFDFDVGNNFVEVKSNGTLFPSYVECRSRCPVFFGS